MPCITAPAPSAAPSPASVPRQLAIEAKQTILDMVDVENHPDAVARELIPQLWSTKQPWFAERLEALQARISKK